MPVATNESYLGAKGGSGVYQAIINLMPPHDIYVEAFLGTGTIMKKKAQARTNIGLEISPGVIDKYHHAADNYTVVCADAIKYLNETEFTGRTLIYLDPPYMLSTRTSNARYEHELTDNDHGRLLNCIKSLAKQKDVFIILSGYRNELYDEVLKDWFSYDFQAMTRGGVRTETVWCSFQPSEQHYHTYAGKDFTDRQRIKRKAKRWAKNFAVLPSGEQQAILNALLSTKVNEVA